MESNNLYSLINNISDTFDTNLTLVYDSIYYNIILKKKKLFNEKSVLINMLKYYESIEEYEKCKIINNKFNKKQNGKNAKYW